MGAGHAPASMPLDHYVSQVHIKNFYSPELGERVYAMRKSDVKKFTPRSQDVCRIEDNSSNSYLKEDRAIEDFLKSIEPKYNAAIAKLRDNKLDEEAVFVIAGFIAYVLTCSPAGMRIQSAPLKNAVEVQAMMLDALGEIGKAPESLDSKSITELLKEGSVAVKIDAKYPQAMGIASIGYFVSVFGNSPWEVLITKDRENPLFTSDFPIAIEVIDAARPINRIVPLAPDLAVRIIPDPSLRGAKRDFTFSKSRAKYRQPHHQEVFHINRLLVQCAEDLVMYRDDRGWAENMVTKYRSFRIEPVTEKIKHGNGYFLPATLRIRSTAT
jgi:hypothetical protein